MKTFSAPSRYLVRKAALALSLFIGLSANSEAATPAEIIAALRMSGVITGGSMPTNSPEFTSMVNSIENNDYYGAALTAVQSRYGAKYLLRRLALQMQNSGLQASITTDNDATAYIMAHFIGIPGVAPSVSKIWSNNLTCLVQNSAGVMVHVGDLTPVERNTINWRTALSCTTGQQAVDFNAPSTDANGDTIVRPKVTIPLKHVGGYVTLSDRPNDTSFAQVGATAGTNLRIIANLWMIATGMDLMAFAAADGRPQNVPRFVPENDPHFLVGNGQTACISCHGGGLVALSHGYSAVADLFDFVGDGFTYNSAPTTNSRKSLGSMQNNRQRTLTCNLSQFTVCNPDSAGVDPNQSWDLAPTWGDRGLLNTIGWNAPTAGQGLNALGTAIGKAGIVYSNLVKRILRETCPLGAVPELDVKKAIQDMQTSDDVKIAIAQIVSNPACR